MDSNTHSTSRPDRLPALAADLQALAAKPLDTLTDPGRAERLKTLRGLLDRLQGQWLGELAAVDARGAAGAEDGVPAPSTAAWLRRRLRMSAATATSLVRTARALFRGPLTGTGQALVDGEVSLAHAQVLAHSTHHLPDQVAAEAEPVLLDAARRLDPPRLRQAITHLRLVADPDGADRRAERQQEQRGVWLSATWEGMVALQGLLDPRPARPCSLPWSRWPARPTPTTPARVASGVPMRWPSWPAAISRAGGCRKRVGCGPSCWSPWTWTACWALAG
jgi:Domain of unknown function (DUF222)